MDMSFYTAARGAMTQQEKLNVVANNMANINTTGFKSKSSAFQDLLYINMKAEEAEDTQLVAGAGVNISHTNTSFASGGMNPTGNRLDYAINGEGMFMLQDTLTNEICYTRAGHFFASERNDGFYLAAADNKLVLDANQQPIRLNGETVFSQPGIFVLENTDGIYSTGDTEFQAVPKNGQPTISTEGKLLQGFVEMSNVDTAEEMANVIEASRAYSYALKMVQTADEVENVINNLR